jgi:hypothetical protein
MDAVFSEGGTDIFLILFRCTWGFKWLIIKYWFMLSLLFNHLQVNKCYIKIID